MTPTTLHPRDAFLTRYLGELELWIDGRSVISVRGLIYRENAASKVQGAHFQTFFGGEALHLAHHHFPE